MITTSVLEIIALQTVIEILIAIAALAALAVALIFMFKGKSTIGNAESA